MIRGAKVTILDPEDRMLILYRSGTHPHVPHTPDLPGGKIEDGESMVEGLVREVREETGIKLEKDQLKFVSKHKEKDYFGEDYYLELYEAILSEQLAVSLSYEHDEFKWIACDDVDVVGKLYSRMLEAYKKTR